VGIIYVSTQTVNYILDKSFNKVEPHPGKAPNRETLSLENGGDSLSDQGEIKTKVYSGKYEWEKRRRQ